MKLQVLLLRAYEFAPNLLGFAGVPRHGANAILLPPPSYCAAIQYVAARRPRRSLI